MEVAGITIGLTVTALPVSESKGLEEEEESGADTVTCAEPAAGIDECSLATGVAVGTSAQEDTITGVVSTSSISSTCTSTVVAVAVAVAVTTLLTLLLLVWTGTEVPASLEV